MMKPFLKKIMATLLLAFGLLTLFMSTSVIFDWFDIRAKEGNYVLFIVLANLISSLLYLFAAYGFFRSRSWTAPVIGLSAVILILSFIGLLIYIGFDGIYETKTISAMIFRITVTLVFAALAYFGLPKDNKAIT